MSSFKIHTGDCAEVLRTIPSESVDSLVTDPPAGIGFMGKEWDGDKGGRDSWVAWLEGVMREALRTLKPGGHALVWALPRTSHWTATAVENAGFEVRDVITHHFGTGFPKSHNLKDEWKGWGTALKPASEHWILARKPLVGTVAANVGSYGTGALNIDASRIGTGGGTKKVVFTKGVPGSSLAGSVDGALNGPSGEPVDGLGRWPSNLLLSHSVDCSGECAPDCPIALMDSQSGVSKSTIGAPRGTTKKGLFANSTFNKVGTEHNDSGGASRFYYVAKPSKRERESGLDGFATRKAGAMVGNTGYSSNRTAGDGVTPVKPVFGKNTHPTVKPIELMRYLTRLVTPPRGVVLDPFVGSGTTGCAAFLENFTFIGIEQNVEYAAIANARITHYAEAV